MNPCAYCKRKPFIEGFKPFCSKRCADLDLGKWLTGGYAFPTEEPGPDQQGNLEESDPYLPVND